MKLSLFKHALLYILTGLISVVLIFGIIFYIYVTGIKRGMVICREEVLTEMTIMNDYILEEGVSDTQTSE